MKDVTVIGSGFGGLGAALRASELGAHVTLLERLGYPGGCASTFTRKGHTFESGATLFSGFGPDQVFDRWIREHGLSVVFHPIDPVVVLRTPSFELPVNRDRDRFVETFSGLPHAPQGLSAFFSHQKTVADTLWAFFDQPERLEPLNAMKHVFTHPTAFASIALRGRTTVADVARRFRVWDFEPLRIFLDAVCQITVQANASDALSVFALPAMDYFFRGTGHIEGGIGSLATAIWDRIESLGGDVRYFSEARDIDRDGKTWRVSTRTGDIKSDAIAANLQPAVVGALLGQQVAPRLQKQVDRGWGAAMLYRVIPDSERLPRHAFHLQLVADPSRPFLEGNHIFCSVSAADEPTEPNTRTMTVSTHIPFDRIDADGEYFDHVQETMRTTLKTLAPEIHGPPILEMTASPRTFARFVGRPQGFVGGIPKTNLRSVVSATPLQPERGLYLVGDSVFPGQSTLAAGISGILVANHILT